MKEKLQSGLDRVKVIYTGEHKKRNILISAGIVAIIIIAVIIAMTMSQNRPYETLFTGMTTEEMSAVVGKLNEYGVTDYRIEGDSIKVPSAQEPGVRSKLLLEGYPKQGYNYDTYFNNIGLMASESDRETVRRFELQDRMRATIRALDGVKDAVVTIAEGSDQRYVLNTENAIPASAAVLVEMQDGGEMPQRYADAIARLVSRSVKGLDFANIEITDSTGASYQPGSESLTNTDASNLKLRLEEQVNNRVRKEVLNALTPLFGADNVKVGVYSTVDVSRSVQETTVYNTPDGAPAGEGIIGHREYDQQLTRNGGDVAAGGVVGADPNATIQTYMENQAVVNGNETWIKNAGLEDHKVNQDVTQRENNSGIVTDLSVAVTINQTVAGDIGVAQIISHVGRAAGIAAADQADKINVLVGPFFNPTAPPEQLPTDSTIFGLPKAALYIAVGVLALLLVLLIVLIIVLRRRKQRELEAVLEEQERLRLLGEDEGAMMMASAYGDPVDNILDIKNEKSLELKQEIRKFTEENPEIAAQMIRAWLKGDEMGG